jgi:histidinol phosphatase-like PHP family hydrolase
MDFVEEIIKEATDQGVAIDLNARYHEPISGYLGLCRKYGAWIIPGSDAHRLEEIGKGFQRLKFASYGF